MLSLLVMVPANLLAWGPIAHLDYAQVMLTQLPTFLPEVKFLLGKFPHDFLYGTLAADITLGKAYVDYIHNCHNWRVGFLILNEADDDRQRACAYGYLAHLAVDIISHNYFVPYTTLASYRARTLGHVYWEMRYDALRPQEVWDLAKEVGRMRFPHNDRLFQRMLKRTLFSFKTNKRIFNSVLTLHRFRHWKTMMGHLSGVSRWQFTERQANEYRKLALESVTGFLQDPQGAPCTKVDPTGADKLLYSQEMQKELRSLTRRRRITTAQAEAFLVRVKHALRAGIYHPGSLPHVSEIL